MKETSSFIIPCKNCITLPICKALATAEREKNKTDSFIFLLLYYVLKDKCSLIEEYIQPKLNKNQYVLNDVNQRRLEALLKPTFKHITHITPQD